MDNNEVQKKKIKDYYELKIKEAEDNLLGDLKNFLREKIENLREKVPDVKYLAMSVCKELSIYTMEEAIPTSPLTNCFADRKEKRRKIYSKTIDSILDFEKNINKDEKLFSEFFNLTIYLEKKYLISIPSSSFENYKEFVSISKNIKKKDPLIDIPSFEVYMDFVDRDEELKKTHSSIHDDFPSFEEFVLTKGKTLEELNEWYKEEYPLPKEK